MDEDLLRGLQVVGKGSAIWLAWVGGGGVRADLESQGFGDLVERLPRLYSGPTPDRSQPGIEHNDRLDPGLADGCVCDCVNQGGRDGDRRQERVQRALDGLRTEKGPWSAQLDQSRQQSSSRDERAFLASSLASIVLLLPWSSAMCPETADRSDWNVPRNADSSVRRDLDVCRQDIQLRFPCGGWGPASPGPGRVTRRTPWRATGLRSPALSASQQPESQAELITHSLRLTVLSLVWPARARADSQPGCQLRARLPQERTRSSLHTQSAVVSALSLLEQNAGL